jgi:hypothetical protein
MTTTPFLEVVERGEVGVELTMLGSGRWHSVPVGMYEERGRSFDEGRRRCRMFQGWRCPFIGGVVEGSGGEERRWNDRSFGGGSEWPIRPLRLIKTRVGGVCNGRGLIGGRGGLASGGGGSHGGSSAAA